MAWLIETQGNKMYVLNTLIQRRLLKFLKSQRNYELNPKMLTHIDYNKHLLSRYVQFTSSHMYFKYK
jgi:hypothetical protein